MAKATEFRTSDMSLAAFLRLAHPITRTEWQSRTCSWVFELADGMTDAIAVFQSGEARVDPVAYNESFAQLKTESFDYGVWESGQVVWFDSQRGFGFVQRENAADDTEDIMFHIKTFGEDTENLVLIKGTKVEFISMTGPKGERCKNIRLAGDQLSHTA